jgi:hypothetical protein
MPHLYSAACPTCRATHRVERDEDGPSLDTVRCADDRCFKWLCSKCDKVRCEGCRLVVCLEHAVVVCGELHCVVCCRLMEEQDPVIAPQDEAAFAAAMARSGYGLEETRDFAGMVQ